MINSLDLYAEIEPYLQIEESYEKLYDMYEEIISGLNVKTILDVGCGNGNFTSRLSGIGYDVIGIDFSKTMVERAIKKDVKAFVGSIFDIKQNFDLVVCAGDVLNYMNGNDLLIFGKEVKKRLSKTGYFLADINTLHGFEDVAQGSFVFESESLFIGIDSIFLNNKLKSSFNRFQKNGEVWKRDNVIIEQFFHKDQDVIASFELKFIKKYPVKMFSNKADKNIYFFENLT